PDGGLNMYMMKVFPETYVEIFTSGIGVSYAFSTADHQLWQGKLGTSNLIQIEAAEEEEKSGSSLHYPFFDYDDHLHAVLVTKVPMIDPLTKTATGMDTLAFSSPYFELSSTKLDFAALLNNDECPYSFIEFQAPNDPVKLRKIYAGDMISGVLHYIPPEIFLDEKSSYEIVVEMMPNIAAGMGVKDLNLKVRLSTPDWIDVTVTKSVDWNEGRAVFKVKLTDRGNIGQQSLPGEGLMTTAVYISVDKGNLNCKVRSDTGDPEVTTTHRFLVYSGCPPYQIINFVWDPAITNSLCPNPEKDIPCAYFDDDFPTIFSIRDLVTNKVVQYMGQYTLKIVGGGRNREELKALPDDVMLRINPNTSRPAGDMTLVWAGNTDLFNEVPIFSAESNAVSWLCAVGSPCNAIRPSARSASPDYYFTFQLSSDRVDMSHSYCLWRTEFPVRVYGLALDFMTSVVITCTSFGIGVIGILCVVFKMRREEKKKQAAVSPEDKGMMSELDALMKG
ncbi:hypothetical protein HK102_010585, partial [Quaeritorhiza haematococci]